MNRLETWKQQGLYVSKKGIKMILVLDKETGATVLESLYMNTTNEPVNLPKCPYCGKYATRMDYHLVDCKKNK